MDHPRFSVIVPVYNRLDEVDELLQSLANQTVKNFEVIIVEDGSTAPCKAAVDKWAQHIDVQYFYKSNEGRSIARNYGLERARGDYFIFFDSDCVIPPTYFVTIAKSLDNNPLDCFGGPDAAHDSFSDMQKAINYAMTSFLTTGGIRGGKVSLEKFTPRTFNMGFSRAVYERVGGFREMFSEDIDMSTRIRQAGFSIGLLRESPVYHKRRLSFKLFARQVYVFGMSRITLHLLYPGSMKLVHLLPAAFVLGSIALIVLSICVKWWLILPLAAYLLAIFVTAWISSKSLKIALMAVPASILQLGGYGVGFLQAFFNKIVLRKGRDVNQEIEMRRGK
ncbi:MAG: glycosyltransferase [Bacteroidales bacterium]|nr:glycosyltransferase [Bacteroidales bacterium]MCD8395151.1 glycosyltransferase [Bacteroidales bacterium]